MLRDYFNNSLKHKLIIYIIGGIAVFFMVLFTWYSISYRPPAAFPTNKIVNVSDGKTLSEISQDLKRDKVIRSSFWFTNFVLLLKHENKVVGGQYYFGKEMNVSEVARRLTKGDYRMDQLKTTVPEGSSVTEIAAILKKNYPTYDSEKFIALAKEREGYLFPDTYYFGADAKPEKIIQTMTATFNTKIQDTELTKVIESFGRPLKDIITMASILEGEARQTRTRQIVAGILWKRMRVGMALQVDTTFKYINGKTTKDLTMDDLKIDSPYNTYLYRGLPPTPISSPGLDAIRAAVTPIDTEYLFFLTDDEGNMHYAATLAEHEYNVDKYLR